jgi:hypothetical protein
MPELGRLSTCAWGETYDVAYALLREIQRDNIQDLIDKRLDVPEPVQEEEYSGRLNLRMPKTLHRRLTEIAREESISLNSLMVNLIYENIGGRKTEKLVEKGIKGVENLIDKLQQVDINLNVQHGIMPINKEQSQEVKERMNIIREKRNDMDFARAG